MPDQELSLVRRQLAAELRRTRTLAGVSQAALGRALGKSQSLAARVENAERLLSMADTRAWLQHVGADIEVRDRVLALTQAAHSETARWADLLKGHPHLQELARQRDDKARLAQNFQPTILPGLLQTADYARFVIQLGKIRDASDRAASLAARLERQAVLREPGRTFQFIIVERLLHWSPAPGVLYPQLAQLIALSDLDTVDLAVLPDTYDGALPWHNFILRYPADEDMPPYVTTELVHGAQTIDDPELVGIYQDLWQKLWGASAKGRDADAMIQEVIVRVAAG